MDINIKIELKENDKSGLPEGLPDKAEKDRVNTISIQNHETDNKATANRPNCFQCKVCPYNTFRKPYLDKHMLQKHRFSKIYVDNKQENISYGKKMDIDIGSSTGIRFDQKIPPSETINEYDDNSNEFSCQQCDFKTRYLTLINIHQEVHKDKEEEVYQCVECEFQTEEVSALRDHEKTHKKLTLFSCPQCDYATRQKCNLKAHMRVHEDPEKSERFICSTCNKFVSFHHSALLRHIKMKHGPDGMTVFNCDKCPFATKVRRNLRSHQKIHDDASTFKCDECDFVTHNKQTMQKHVQRHKDRQKGGEEVIVKVQMEEKEIIWFCCNLCDFRSKDQRYVILHKKVHTRVDEINKIGESIVQSAEIKTEIKIEN